MPEHKHKPKMVMVISIGDKPKKKGETGVKKGLKPGEICPSCENSGEVRGRSGPVPCPVCRDACGCKAGEHCRLCSEEG